MDFKCKKPSLVTVVLKLTEISLKPQLQTMILQFFLKSQLLIAVLKEVSLKPQLVTVVLQLFLIRPHFNGVIILILFLKYFFYQNNHKTTVSNCGFTNGVVILILFLK